MALNFSGDVSMTIQTAVVEKAGIPLRSHMSARRAIIQVLAESEGRIPTHALYRILHIIAEALTHNAPH